MLGDVNSYRSLSPTAPTTGFVAISVHDLVMSNAQDGSFEWLKSYTPIELVGKSIYLFHIEN
jgi:hypothetical protein